MHRTEAVRRPAWRASRWWPGQAGTTRRLPGKAATRAVHTARAIASSQSHLLVVLLAVLAAPARASATVDMTGSWMSDYYGDGTLTQVDFLQAGTALTLQSGGSPPDHGTIDPDTGVFHFDLNLPNDTLCSVKLDGTAAPDGNSFSGTLTVTLLGFFPPFCATTERFAVSGTRCPTCAPLTCGDGTLGADEECDDGNRVGGDCCSPHCTLVAAGATCSADDDPCTTDLCDGNGACLVSGPAATGTPCGADASACTADACDGLGACTHGPHGGCRRPSRSARLTVRRDGPRSRVKLVWKDGSGATARTDFGDPTAATDVRLCVFSGSTLVLDAAAPAADGCGAPRCWQAKPRGYAYRSARGTPDGLSRVMLHATPAGRALVSVIGKGDDLPFVSDPREPLRAQVLSIDGGGGQRCWDGP